MPEGAENEQSQDDLERVTLENEEPDRELKFQNKLVEVHDDVIQKINSSNIETSKVFDILIDTPEQRKSIEHIYGIDEIVQLEKGLNNLPTENKTELINSIVEQLTPVLRRFYFEPEVIARVQDIKKEDVQKVIKTEIFEVIFKSSPHEFTLGAGTEGEVKIQKGDTIMEINLPENTPWGLQAARKSLKEVAKLLEQRPDVKAVGGNSWMNSRNITSEIGFEKFPDLRIDDEVREGSILTALAGRKDKPYKNGKQPVPSDVIFGAMSREEFIRRFL